MTQRCPHCKQDLEQADYTPSHWGEPGRKCRKCHVARIRKANLMKNYGLTLDDIALMLERQQGRCLGCRVELPVNYVVDHDHTSGVVRGLLCRPCNLVLGLVKEDKARLTRLRLYLDRDPAKVSIYVIGSLRNPQVAAIGNTLRTLGFDVWDEWFAAGPEADDYWQRYEKGKGRTFEEALKGRTAQNVFYFDKALIDLADIGVLVMPAGKSGHLELGYMAAQGKPTFVLMDQEPERFDVMAQFATAVFTSEEALLARLTKETK